MKAGTCRATLERAETDRDGAALWRYIRAAMTSRKQLFRIALGLLVLVAAVLLLVQSATGRRFLVAKMSKAYSEVPKGPFVPEFDGDDAARTRLRIDLSPVATGFRQPTDVQFVPGLENTAVVLEKGGAAHWVSTQNGASRTLLQVDVLGASEQGLLGLAFHPRFAENGRFFLNYTLRKGDADISRVEEWTVPSPRDPSGAKAAQVVLEVAQPYQNHNGGGLAFGPDGYLYIGWGDGGFRADPLGAGQDRSKWLGKMLRIDVDAKSEGRNYSVPNDNPFRGQPGMKDEIWAYGLRNPWRYSFDPQGRLIVADVGQDRWEEVSIVQRGDNLGWNVKEGFACFKPETGCNSAGLRDPIHVYGRSEGVSITGGHVYTGALVERLEGQYVFGDFATGRLWSLALPTKPEKVAAVSSLGRWPLHPSAFGRDHHGELYVLCFSRGELYRIVPAKD
jgi:glucose/arabinose dehydrogenase